MAPFVGHFDYKVYTTWAKKYSNPKKKKKKAQPATIISMASRENVRVKSITVCPCKIILVKIVTKIILVKIVAFYVSTRIAAI